MVPQADYVKALQYAATLVGGAAELASRLGLSQSSVRAMLLGEELLPDSVFQKTVDLILEVVDRHTSEDRAKHSIGRGGEI